MIFEKGFIKGHKRYGWYNKELYRLPFKKNDRYYALKKLKPKIVSTTLLYNIDRNPRTINTILDWTKEVNWEVQTNRFDKDLPI